MFLLKFKLKGMLKCMYISSITFKYNSDKQVEGYTIYIDGEDGDVQAFSGQVNMDSTELDLSNIPKLVQKKIVDCIGGTLNAD